jgi:chemotaxis protein MotB
MRKIPVIVLSVLLAGALVFCILFYKRSEKSEAALVASEEKISRLNEEKASILRKIRQTEEQLGPLKQAEKRVEELETTLAKKERSLSELQGKVLQLKQESQENTKEIQDLIAQGRSKDRVVTELKGQLVQASSHAAALEEKIAEGEAERNTRVKTLETELERVRSRADSQEEKIRRDQAQKDAELMTLKGKLEQAMSQVGSLQEKVAELETARDAVVTGLEAKLERDSSQITSLKKKLAGCEQGASSLEKGLSDLKSQRENLEMQLDEMKSTHRAMLRDLQSQIQNKEVTISSLKEKLSISFVDRILFEFGKATIRPEGEEILTKVGTILKNVGTKQIRVIGHTDDKPIHPDYRYKFPSNWELSTARAAAVVRYFQNEIGLDPGNLEAVGHSFYDPVASNETAEGRAQNRRVNIIIGPKLK